MSAILKEMAGYTAASVVALTADVCALWMLVRFVGLSHLAAATASFLLGGVVAYWMSIKLAFTRHRLRDRRLEFTSFMVIGVAGLLINDGVIFVMSDVLDFHYLLAKGVAAGCTFAFNFGTRRQLLFVQR